MLACLQYKHWSQKHQETVWSWTSRLDLGVLEILQNLCSSDCSDTQSKNIWDFSPIKCELFTARRLLLLNDAARVVGGANGCSFVIEGVLCFTAPCSLLHLLVFYTALDWWLLTVLQEAASHVSMQSDEVQTRSPSSSFSFITCRQEKKRLKWKEWMNKKGCTSNIGKFFWGTGLRAGRRNDDKEG